MYSRIFSLAPFLVVALFAFPLVACGSDAESNDNGNGNGTVASVTFSDAPEIAVGDEYRSRIRYSHAMTFEVVAGTDDDNGEDRLPSEISHIDDIHMNISVHDVDDTGALSAVQISVRTNRTSGEHEGGEVDQVRPTAGNTYLAVRDNHGEWGFTRDGGEEITARERDDLRRFVNMHLVADLQARLTGRTFEAGDSLRLNSDTLPGLNVQGDEDLEIQFEVVFQQVESHDTGRAARFGLTLTMSRESSRSDFAAELKGHMLIDLETFHIIYAEIKGQSQLNEEGPDFHAQGEGEVSYTNVTEIHRAE